MVTLEDLSRGYQIDNFIPFGNRFGPTMNQGELLGIDPSGSFREAIYEGLFSSNQSDEFRICLFVVCDKTERLSARVSSSGTVLGSRLRAENFCL
ncbi:hypothetical protein TNCV_359521 [Trichonephila clavipes]|nr:hypothetical protein TNCV_359521 [Trichonephila clavipes]